MPDRADELADGLVWVEHHLSAIDLSLWAVLVFGRQVGVYEAKDSADKEAQAIRVHLTAALRTAQAEAVQTALREALVDDGPGERPVSKEREKEIRALHGKPGGPRARRPEAWEVECLFILLDHERAVSAHLRKQFLHALTDGGYMEGVEAGRAMAQSGRRRSNDAADLPPSPTTPHSP